MRAMLCRTAVDSRLRPQTNGLTTAPLANAICHQANICQFASLTPEAVFRRKLPTASSTPFSPPNPLVRGRSEEHTSELQSLMRISYAVFCLNKKRTNEQQLT